MELVQGLHLSLPHRGLFAALVVSSEEELSRFLQQYAEHQAVQPPKGRKTWAALLVAMHKKAQGLAQPLDRMADSKVTTADVFVPQEPVSIQQVGDRFEVVGYGRGFERTAQALMEKETDAKARKRVEQVYTFIRRTLETKRRVLNHVLNTQRAFVASGDVMDILPLNQRDIAIEVGLHLSTINRIMNSVRLYRGRRPIKSVFLTPGSQYNRIVLTEAIRRIRIKHKTKDNGGVLSAQVIAWILDKEYAGKFKTKYGDGRSSRRTVAKFSKSPREKTKRPRRQRT
jgi:DNA-directed RNA polymerase specialized sigma54-like protein